MMFRDEADIIEKCLGHWYALGVRNFYLCDNVSVDGSGEIVAQWIKRNLADGDWTLVRADETDWPGRRIINVLKMTALRCGCNFIFPADADEFLELPYEYRSVQEWAEALGVPDGYGELPYLNILPDGRSYWQQPQKKAFGWIREKQMISMGNHIIEGKKPSVDPLGAYYKHYSLRSYEQFKKKMENYMIAFHQTEFKSHPHSIDHGRWQERGESFLRERWELLTTMEI